MKLLAALICTCALLAQSAFAADVVSFNFGGCQDSRERAVKSVADPALPMLVETRFVEGDRIIYYNPSRLPQLLPETRAFVYAHECAWTRLGMPIDRERSAENARRADCWAIDTLTRSKLIKPGAVEAIEMDLAMAGADSASQLPGPVRELKLASCTGSKILATQGKSKGNVVNVDTSATVSPAWNACVQGCGNKLFACGRGATCQTSFDQCKAGCADK